MKDTQNQPKLSFKQIEGATNNFETCIGIGGYGLVYKGELSVQGKLTKVAIKRLDEQFGQGSKEFSTEIELLSGQEHENLISLMGYCDEGKEKIIVYEYAEHGSLDVYIDPGSSNTTYILSWLERLKICVGAARGINHLHNHAGEHQTIIHRDIKSSNILLDENWVAKISDLGLSRLGLADYDRSAVISRACGTPGYCEPEYISSGVVTKESDVYSFGMVLFEVLCGRLCTVADDDGFILLDKVKGSYETGNLDEMIEPSLREQMSPVSMNKFSTVAYKCLHDDREQRPPIGIVAKELQRSLKIQEEYELEKEQKLKNTSDDNYWHKKLPDDVEDILSGLDPPLVYGTSKELFSLLREGLFFDREHRFFSINNDGIKREMISAHTFLKWISRTMMSPNFIRATSIFTPRPVYGGRREGSGRTRGRGRVRVRWRGRGRFREETDDDDNDEYAQPERCTVIGQYPHIKSQNIRCKISTSMLSWGIMYAANLVFSVGTWSNYGSVKSSPNCLWIKWQCQELCVSSAHYAQQLEDTCENNGLTMLKATLWHFVNIDNNAGFEILINKILGGPEDRFPYIVIHGIIFEPVDTKKQHDGADEDADWEKNMPGDYEKIIARSDTHLEYTTKEELYFLLCGGILIDNGRKWFSLCKSTGGKCHMLAAREISFIDNNHKLVKRSSLSESRFEKMIRLPKEGEHRFICEIESPMFSSGRAYACYLVFKLVNLDTTTSQDTCLLRTSYKMDRLTRSEAYAHLKLRNMDIPIIKPIKNNRFRDSRNIPKNKDSFFPKERLDGKLHNFMEYRNDGWMEVLLFKELSFEDNQSMEVGLLCIEGDSDGVIVQGIEFRPMETDVQGKKLSDIFVKWARARLSTY